MARHEPAQNVAVAAAAASLLDLREASIAHVLNAAASISAGLKQNCGSRVKPMYVGQVVRSALTAVILAADGFEAVKDAIDGAEGFFDLYGTWFDAGLEIRPPGIDDPLVEFGIK